MRVVGSEVFVDERKVGWLTKTAEGTKIFVSPRIRSTHFFRNFQGWGISKEVYAYLRLVGVEEIHLKIGRAVTLISTIDNWEKHSVPYQREPYESQLILPEMYMEKQELTLSQLMEWRG